MGTLKRRVANDPVEVESLKTTLFAALDRTGLNLKEINEKCGLANANSIYNLRNGHSETFSILTYFSLAQRLNLPINELFGTLDYTSTTLASARASASIQVAAERFARSFAFVRTAMVQYYEQQVKPNDPARDQAAKTNLLSGFLRIDCGLEAVAHYIAELLNQLREALPEAPPLPPL